VGNTGYGYGDTDAVALSEELMSDFASNLGAEATVPVGQALIKAKQEYALNSMGFYGPYDEKVLIEATLYGVPMYRVSVPSPGGGLSVFEQGSKGASEQGSRGQFTSAPPHLRTSAQAGLIVRSYTVTPTLTAVNTLRGTYYTADGGVQAVLYRPLQPSMSLDIALPGGVGDGAVAQGALFLGGNYTDIPNFDPVITMPVTEATRYEPQWIYTGWHPQGLVRINHFQTPQGVLERLVLILGQFRHTNVVGNHVEGIQRLYNQVTYEVYYSTTDDITPPTIESVTAQRQDSVVQFVVKVSDASGVSRVIVVYTDGTGTWESLDLTYDPDADEWVGELSGADDELVFWAQAVDGAGNVGVNRAKGLYLLTTTVDVGADQIVNEGDEITFSGSGPAGATTVWDFGDGLGATGTYAPSHWYRDDGLFEVSLRVSDEEGRTGMDTLFVTVNNVAPTVSIDKVTPSSRLLSSGGVVTFNVSFTDPGVLDTHSAIIYWHDGTVEAVTVNQGAGSGTIVVSHVCADPPTCEIKVCVTDDEGGVDCDPFPLIPVGGIIVPLNKPDLLAPWVGLVALMVAVIAAAMIERRRSA